jgi:serine/threonine-protein kinase
MVGQTLRNYLVLARLGAGGMGEVYLAEHTRLRRKVALKVLLPVLSAHTEAVARFFAEARATAQLQSPRIVQIFDCDVHADGRAFLAMEYLEGETLAQRLARGPLAPDYPLVARLGAQIAAGLEAAHARGIIHRDLKPANIFLCPGEASGPAVKLLDFGLAKLVDEVHAPAAVNTRSGEIIGTPAYMSPEQCRGHGAVDARSDLYSLGCILFEMCCGRRPFVCDGVGELISAHLRELPADPHDLQPALPRPLRGLILALLEKDPAHRPPSAGAVRESLEAFAAGDASVPPAATSVAPGGRRGQGRALWTLVTVAGLAGAGAFLLWSPARERRPAPPDPPAPVVVSPVAPDTSPPAPDAQAPDAAPTPLARPPRRPKKMKRAASPVAAPPPAPIYKPFED